MNDLISTFAIWSPGALAMVLLIIGSGFFSGSETALFYLSRDELRRFQTGGPSARLAASLMRDPDRLLTVVLFWNLMINLSYFAVSLVTAKRLVDEGYPAIAGGISLGALFGIILFGEVIPKSVAVIFRRRIAISASWPLAIAVRILSPILPMLSVTTRGLKRAMFPNLKAEPYFEINDIERAIDSSEVGTEIIQLEQKILGRIVELTEMKAEELMRPRGTYPVLQPPIELKELVGLTQEFPYLLISEGESESLVGAIPLAEMSAFPKTNLESSAEAVVYIPWCGKVSEALSKMRMELVSVAVVLNEYGESIGIITEDDAIDTLLNPESSRAKRLLDREPVRELKDGRILADGLTTLRYLSQRVGFEYEPRDDGLLTIAALMHDRLARFPIVGDECDWEGFRFRVTKAGEPGESIQVEVVQTEETMDSESNEESQQH